MKFSFSHLTQILWFFSAKMIRHEKKSSAISENYILIWKCFNRGSIWQVDPKPIKSMKKFARSLQNIFSHTKSMCKTGKINCQIRDLPPIYDSLCIFIKNTPEGQNLIRNFPISHSALERKRKK